jgi:hypothetical protein
VLWITFLQFLLEESASMLIFAERSHVTLQVFKTQASELVGLFSALLLSWCSSYPAIGCDYAILR